MLRDEILEKLRADRPTLDEYGVTVIGIFGSVARGEEGPESDVDLVVDFAKDSTPGLFKLVGLKLHLEKLLGAPVDLVTPGSPNRRIDEALKRDAIYA